MTQWGKSVAATQTQAAGLFPIGDAKEVEFVFGVLRYGVVRLRSTKVECDNRRDSRIQRGRYARGIATARHGADEDDTILVDFIQ